MADRQPPDSRPGPPVDPGDAVATLLAQGVGTVYPAAGLLCRLGRDTLRQDADALGYDYENFDSLESSATIDPDGSIAQSAYVLFTYGADRCPEGATDSTTTTAAG
mgnify:CR=1 FL=1